MSGLVRCPLCGASEGYYLIDGSRWWKVACDACGQVIAEVPSTRDWKPPPKQCDSADAAWNAAGAHAQSMRDEIASVYAAIASVGARYLDPPDGGDVPIGEQVRRLAADAQSLRDRVAALESAIKSVLLEFDTATVVSKGQVWRSVSVGHAAPGRILTALEAVLEQKP